MLLALLALLTQAPADSTREDAATLIQRVIDEQDRQQLAQRAFAFRERTVTDHLDDDGTISRTESETFVVTPATGGEYRRLVAKDGRPLTPREEDKEQKKLDKHVEENLRLSEEERERKTREKLEDRIERYQTRLEEALEVYDFEPLPDEFLHGIPVRVFHFSPKPGYKGHSRPTKIFARMEGTIWIDPERNQLAKLSIAFTRDLTFLGGVFGRVSKGTRARVEGAMRDGLWMLDNVEVSLNARLYFLKRYRRRITVVYDDYRKYQVDTDEELSPLSTSR